MYKEFFVIFLFLLVAIVFSLILYGFSFFIVLKSSDSEKSSAYECGFDPFEDTHGKFDVKFYLVALLFIIFDLEISFLFPWSVVLGRIGLFGFLVMFFFLFILVVGFFYEWRKGALDW